MKRMMCLFVVVLFTAGLVGCAMPSSQKENVKVKCPACGYEFDTPVAHE